MVILHRWKMNYWKPHPRNPNDKMMVEVIIPVEYVAGNDERNRFCMAVPEEIAHQLGVKFVQGNTAERASSHMVALFTRYYEHLMPKTKTKIIVFNVNTGYGQYDKDYSIKHQVVWRVQQSGMGDTIENEDGSTGGHWVGGNHFDKTSKNWMHWTSEREKFFVDAEARIEELKQFVAHKLQDILYGDVEEDGKRRILEGHDVGLRIDHGQIGISFSTPLLAPGKEEES